jgi:hypothetical protein
MIDFRQRHVMAIVIKATPVLYDLERFAILQDRASFFVILNFIGSFGAEVNCSVNRTQPETAT